MVSQCQVRQCLTYMAGEETRACTASGPLLPQKAARLGLPSRHTASAWLCQQALEQRRQLLKQPVSRQAAKPSKQATPARRRRRVVRHIVQFARQSAMRCVCWMYSSVGV